MGAKTRGRIIEKMKKIILFFMVLLILPVLSFADDCGEVLEINSECDLVSPNLFCSTYNYTIYNSTGIEQQGNLINRVDNIYYFEFNLTQNEKDFVVSLCDGSTKQLSVRGEESMNITIMNLTFAGILSIISTLGLISLALLSTYNLFSVVTVYNFRQAWVLLLIKIITFGMALLTSMLDYNSLLSNLMLKISAFFFVVIIMLFIAELFFYMKSSIYTSVDAYQPKRENNYR